MRKLASAAAVLLVFVACNKSNRSSTSQPGSTVTREAPPADHTIDATGFVAHDLAHGNNAFRLELNRQWRGSANLNTRFGPGWSDQNDVRLLMLNPKLVVIERGGVGWREAYRKDDKTFEGTEGDKIQRTDQGWTVQMPHGFTYTFNSKGRLTSAKPPAGPSRSYAYDGKGRLTTVGTGPRNVLQYDYDNQNRVTTIHGPEGLRATYEYDKNGRLLSVVTARAYRIHYEYTADGKLSTAWDQLGSGVSLSQLSATTAVLAKPAEQLGAAGRTAKYQFDTQGRPTTVTEDGSTKSYKYDGSGSLGEITDGKQKATCKYDAFGRVTAVQAADGSSIQLEYNNLDLPTLVRKADGTVEKLKYDEHGRIIRTERSPSDWEEVSYDSAGRIETRRTPPAAERRYSFGDGDHVSRVQYSNGKVVNFEYDPQGRLLGETWSSGEKRTWRYNAKGQVIESTAPTGLRTTYGYDAQGQLISTDESIHGKTTYRTAKNGDVVESAIGKTARKLTAWGKPLELTEPGGARKAFIYDARGLLEQVLSPVNMPWRYEYNSAGKLTAIVAPSGLRTSTGWDFAGRQTKVTRGNTLWRNYHYNSAGLLDQEFSGIGRAAQYFYASDQHLAAIELPDGKVSYSGDKNGLQFVQKSAAYEVEDNYNSDGTLLSRRYSPAKLEVKLPVDSVGRSAGIELNSLKASYSYNGQGQLSEIALPGGSTIKFVFDQAGRPTQFSFGTGLIEKISYDRADRITSIDAKQTSGKSLFAEQYAYDAAGNLSERVTNSGPPSKFVYDRAGRLTHGSGPRGSVTYSYDLDGNLATNSVGGRCHLDNLGRPTDQEATAYAWDAAGNLTEIRTSKAKIANVFDAAGRLVEHREGKNIWKFGYDSRHDRLWEQTPSGKRWFAYLDNRLAGFTDESGATWLVVSFPGTDQPLALCGSNGQILFVVSDPLGSARRFTNSSGATAASDDYSAFGNLVASNGKRPIAIYAGMVRDGTGLFYARRRYYDPTIARFISIDPLVGTPGEPASHNPYAYASNNPLRFRDPMGTNFDDEIGDYHKLYDYVYKKDPKDPTGRTFLKDANGDPVPETYQSGPFKGEPVVDKSQPATSVPNSSYDNLPASEQQAVRNAYDGAKTARQTIANPNSTVEEITNAQASLAQNEAELARLNEIANLRAGHNVMLGGERAGWGGENSQQRMMNNEQRISELGGDPFAQYSPETRAQLEAERAAGLSPAEAAAKYKAAADQRAAAEAATKANAEAEKAAAEQAAADEAARDARRAWVPGKNDTQQVPKTGDGDKTGQVAGSDSNKTGQVNAGSESENAAAKGTAKTAAEANAGKSQADLAASAREKIQRSLQTNEAISVSKEEMDAYDAEEAAKKAGQNALVPQGQQPQGGQSTAGTGNAGTAGENVGDTYRPRVDGQRPAPKGDIDMKLDPADGVWKPKGPVGGGAGIVGEGGEVGERWLGPMILEQGGKVLKWLKPIGEVAGPIAELIGTADLAAKMANNFIDNLNEPFMKEKRERDAAKWAEEKYKQQLAQLAAGDPDNIATRDGHKFDPNNKSDMDDLLSDLSDNLYWGRTPYNGLFKSGKISKKAASAPTSFMSADSGDTAAPTALADAWKKMQTAIEMEKTATEAAKECIRQQEEAKSQLENAVTMCGARGVGAADVSQLPVTADDVKKQTEAVKNQTKTLSQAYTDMSAAIDKTDDTALKVCQLANEAASGATPEKVAELKTKATNELQSATDMLNNAQAKLDGADFAVDQLTSSKAKLEGFRTSLSVFGMAKGAVDAATTKPDDMLKAANTAAKAASDARSKLDPLVSNVKSLGSQVVGIIAPFVSSDPEAAALSAAAQNLGNDIPDVGLFDFGMLVSLASPVVNGFIANQKGVEEAIGKIDIDALVTAASDALQAADSARQSAKTLATGPDRYQGLQNASTCFAMMGNVTPNNTAQTSSDTGGSTDSTAGSDQNLAAVPPVDKIDTAESVITAAGFTPNIVGLAPSSKDMEFKLAGQDPGAGEMLARGKTVTVYFYQSYGDTVSPTPTPMVVAMNSPGTSPGASSSPSNQGPSMMPKLTGLTLDQAVTRLGKHMRIGSDEVGSKPPSPEKAMTIYLQSPAAGTKVDPEKETVVSVKRYGSAKTEEPASTPSEGNDPWLGSWWGKAWYGDQEKDHEIIIKKSEVGPGYTIFVPPHMDFGYPINGDAKTLSHTFGIYHITWVLSGNTMQGACWYTDYKNERHDMQRTLTRK